MNIQELKLKSSEQLITQAEELGIENASTLRKQEILFAILKKVQECNSKGLPILVGTTSIEKSQKISDILHKNKIDHIFS